MGLKGDFLKCCSKQAEAEAIKYSINDYKTEIGHIFQELEDPNKSNGYLIDLLTRLCLPDILKSKLKDVKSGYDDYSLLHIAAKTTRAPLCLHLIDNYHFDKDILTKSKVTPLQTLIKYNIIAKTSTEVDYEEKKNLFLETFKVLIEKQSDINRQDENGLSALHVAAQKNNYEAVFNLVQLSSLKINIEDKNLMTPLHLACKFGYEDVALLLIKYTDPDQLCLNRATLPTSAHLVCRNKDEKVEILRQILRKLRSVSTQEANYLEYMLQMEDNTKQTLMHIAIKNNHLNIIDMLFNEFSADKETKEGQNGNLPIHSAAKNGSLQLLKILERYDAVSFKTNSEMKNALHIAAESNSYNFIKEFLTYELALVNHTESDQMNLMFCACVCDFPSDHVASIKMQNKQRFTPFMTALAYGNHKCVEEMANLWTNIDLEIKDIESNSIYHICAHFNNTESLKFLLTKFFAKTSHLLYTKNKMDETVMHVACRQGNLEVIKMILNKIYETANLSANALLYSQNKDGLTCFHIACMNGFSNIANYFLKEKKLNLYLDYTDNSLNTSLHMATQNGHSSVVSLLLEFDMDLEAKNEENLTALDLSCRKRSFEISKLLISKYEVMTQSHVPLHTACQEGAHEVVSMLLSKGALIDKLNEENQNCLDIAIARGHNEVVRVLLNNENWQKLIRESNYDHGATIFEELNNLSIVTNSQTNMAGYAGTLNTDTNAVQSNSARDSEPPKLIENPELVAMFDKKMWDGFKLFLDRCIHDKEMDFTKLDMNCLSIDKHPLMLVARSGQESLLKHRTVSTLLDLKWRLIPRFAFYFNILFYMFFLTLISMYSLELADVGMEWYNEYTERANENMNSENSTDFVEDVGDIYSRKYYSPHALLIGLLMAIISLNIVKELFQFLLIEGLSYFMSVQNIIEFFTYFLTLASLLTSDYTQKSAYGSVGVLLAFLVFPLYIQKLKLFGVYVVAFCRTLKNSAKFFPIFLIIYGGFFLAFKIRANFGVTYFDSTIFSLVRTLTMVSGELDTVKMGLSDEFASVPNYLIYIMFIVLMCTILINLFVGIAVGEIKTVLDEADIQQISMRIMFVLKVQSAVYPFQKTGLFKIFNMSYTKYSLQPANGITKFLEEQWARFFKVFQSKEPEIILQDPQKRLEDSFLDMSTKSLDQIKSMKSLFDNQVNDVRDKLSNSHVRVEDGLNEMSRNTTSYLENLTEQLNTNSKNLLNKIQVTEDKLDSIVIKSSNRSIDEVNFMKAYLDSRLNGIEQKLNTQIEAVSKNVLFCLDELNKTFLDRTHDLENALGKSERSLFECTVDSSHSLKNELNHVKSQTQKFQDDLHELNDQVAIIKELVMRKEENPVEEAVAKPPQPGSSKPREKRDWRK